MLELDVKLGSFVVAISTILCGVVLAKLLVELLIIKLVDVMLNKPLLVKLVPSIFEVYDTV